MDSTPSALASKKDTVMTFNKKILAIFLLASTLIACGSDSDDSSVDENLSENIDQVPGRVDPDTPVDPETPVDPLDPLDPVDPDTGQVFPSTGYTKIGNDGIILADQTQAWDDNGSEAAGTQWSCVRDNDTGLYWEVKTNDGGLRDKDWEYTWYDTNPATNGGDVGNDGYILSCSESGSTSELLCNTEVYEDAVNSIQLCGFNDWRMPTADGSQDAIVGAQELQSLLNCQGFSVYDLEERDDTDCVFKGSPLIDTDYFPNTRSFYYWSSASYSSYIASVWGVNFGDGGDLANSKIGRAPVRLVRSSQSLQAEDRR